MDLSDMWNIAYVKEIKNNNFFIEKQQSFIKSYIFNIKCTNFNTNLLF